MPSPIEILSHRLTAIGTVIVILGMAMAFMDSRHASASDVELLAGDVSTLSKGLEAEREERFEVQIANAERRIRAIHTIPAVKRSAYEIIELEASQHERDRYVRYLKRIRKESK